LLLLTNSPQKELQIRELKAKMGFGDLWYLTSDRKTNSVYEHDLRDLELKATLRSRLLMTTSFREGPKDFELQATLDFVRHSHPPLSDK